MRRCSAYKEGEDVTRAILIGDAQPHSLEKAIRQAANLSNKGRPVFAFRAGSSYIVRYTVLAKLLIMPT